MNESNFGHAATASTSALEHHDEDLEREEIDEDPADKAQREY
jgi:hypothetical protein